MQPYMDHTHPDAFLDFVLREPYARDTKLCPVCHGYGGWNLRLNAYRLPEGLPDTAENRHKYVHFRQSCGTCNGWGYVHKDMNCSGHEWKFVQNLGRCYNRYRCTKCDTVNDVDSSD